MTKLHVTDIIQSKAFKAVKKSAGEERAEEICKLDKAALKALISSAVVQEQELKDQTHENPKYQAAAEAKKVFDDALKDTKGPIEAARKLATFILQHGSVE